jgi:hypothetical protein
VIISLFGCEFLKKYQKNGKNLFISKFEAKTQQGALIVLKSRRTKVVQLIFPQFLKRICTGQINFGIINFKTLIFKFEKIMSMNEKLNPAILKNTAIETKLKISEKTKYFKSMYVIILQPLD